MPQLHKGTLSPFFSLEHFLARRITGSPIFPAQLPLPNQISPTTAATPSPHSGEVQLVGRTAKRARGCACEVGLHGYGGLCLIYLPTELHPFVPFPCISDKPSHCTCNLFLLFFWLLASYRSQERCSQRCAVENKAANVSSNSALRSPVSPSSAHATPQRVTRFPQLQSSALTPYARPRVV